MNIIHILSSFPVFIALCIVAVVLMTVLPRRKTSVRSVKSSKK